MTPHGTHRRALMIVGAFLILFGLYAAYERARFVSRSIELHGTVTRVRREQVEVIAHGLDSTIWLPRMPTSRLTRKSYHVGQSVEIRIDTTGTEPAAFERAAYMNSLYGMWFEPVAAVLLGMFLFVLGLALPRPWHLPQAADRGT